MEHKSITFKKTCKNVQLYVLFFRQTLQSDEIYKVEGPKFEGDFIKNYPPDVNQINTVSSQKKCSIPRKDSVNFSYKNLSGKKVYVLQACIKMSFAEGVDKSLVKLGSIVLTSDYKLTIGSGTHSENNDLVQIVCFLYKLLSPCN